MRPTSIRGKIAAGYLLSFLFLLVIAAILFVSLLVAEHQVGSYFGTSRFLDTTLEMRRFEKNYLLYRKGEDLRAAIEYADSAVALVTSGTVGGLEEAAWHRRWQEFLGPGREDGPRGATPEEAERLLVDYRARLKAAGEGRGDAAALEVGIRDLGRRITGIAERLSSVEGQNIQAMLRSGRRMLVLLVVLFLLGTVVTARMVVLTAIRPLKELEIEMQRIASGDYRTLPAGSPTDEIGSMKEAFNRMIREVLEHRQEIIQSERLASLGTMLAGIAHEINNPLSNISTSAEILREENDAAGPEERRALIHQIVSETNRATDVIRTVLDHSRETPFDPRPTNLLSAIRSAMVLVRGELPAHVTVEVDVAPEIELLADKTKLERAFINLMTNAVDAMRDAGRENRIAISARTTGERDVEIVFRDSGAGIPPQQIGRIFDPFFTTKDVGEGTGLGLYLTHEIVEQHGGTIRVESAVDVGTTVFVRLPRPDPRHAPGPRASTEERV